MLFRNATMRCLRVESRRPKVLVMSRKQRLEVRGYMCWVADSCSAGCFGEATVAKCPATVEGALQSSKLATPTRTNLRHGWRLRQLVTTCATSIPSQTGLTTGRAIPSFLYISIIHYSCNTLRARESLKRPVPIFEAQAPSVPSTKSTDSSLRI